MAKIVVMSETKNDRSIIERCTAAVFGKENAETTCFRQEMSMLSAIKSGADFDICFLDMEAAKLEGIELAKKIRKLLKEVVIIFLADSDQYAMAGYDLEIRAYQYILKKNLKQDLPLILEALQTEIAGEEKKYYVIRKWYQTSKVRYDDILFVYEERKNIVIVTSGCVYRENNDLESFHDDLRRDEFVFAKNGMVVNIKKVKKTKGEEVELIDGTTLSIGKINTDRLKDEMENYWYGVS